MGIAWDLGPVGRAVIAAFLMIQGAGAASAGAPVDLERTYPAPYAHVVVDANAGKVLHADKAEELRHPASLTKVMTLYLLFEDLEAGKIRLDSELVVSEHATMMEPTKLDLDAGDTVHVKDAILGLVTKSANDAAVVVAEALAGTERAFAERMNRKARELGMNHTHYCNASGLPDCDQVTTALDQAILGVAIQDHFPRYYQFFSTQSFTWRGKRLKNHNKLLGRMKGMDGIKTGYIRASKFNLLASVRRNDRHIVAVVMGGQSARARDIRIRGLMEHFLAECTPRKRELAASSRTE